jgi:prepilin-type N-terminal cleavage/methylation domain-containing protein
MGVSMKNKGFTLIELLAVLVLLAVISVITIPNVLTSLNNTKEQTLLRSADNLIKTAELKFLDSIFQGYHSTYEEGILTSGEELSFKGKTPDYLAINVNDEGRVSIAMWDNSINKCVVKGYNDNETRFEAAADYVECMSYAGTTIVVLFTQVTDTNPGVICSATETEDYANNSTCYVRSIEDLVQLSELAKTNNFSTKTIYLEANLDFENDISYINPNTTVFGDINGNSIVEPLKTELTTGAGFLPIGNNTINFSGIFNGNMNILQNLYINRNVSYVGLFGRILGATIEGLNINNYTITGTNYTGLIGYASTSSIVKGLNLLNGTVSGESYVGLVAGTFTSSGSLMTAVNVEGTVNGATYVGGAFGQGSGSPSFKNLVVNANVTGSDYVGGIGGNTYSTTYSGSLTNSVYVGGSVIDTDGIGYFGRVNGRGTLVNTYANENILVNDVKVSTSSTNGINTIENNLSYIAFYDGIVDTFVGGDEDLDGYYFDFNDSEELSTMKPSLPTFTNGLGTNEEPYLIENYTDFKNATYDLSKSYRLMIDLDLSLKNIYPFGNKNISFSGKFDGNGKTLSNLKIYGTNYSGFFGQTSGATVENLTVDNFEISGVDYVGFFGYPGANTTIKGLNLYDGTVIGNDYVGLLLGRGASTTLIFNTINIQGTVTGRNYVGGAGGHVTAASLKSLVVSADVTGLDNVGGIAGSLYASTNSGILHDSIYKSGTVTDTDGSGNYARISGYGGSLANNFANETILVNGITVASNTLNGTNIPATSLNHISVYEGVVDTFIGGDNDLDGYYFDYNGTGEIVAVKAQAPISMIGSGSIEDPYLVYNYNDLKRATYDITKSYKLMSNINLLNEKIYPFGSNKNVFSGVFDGNGYTLSNMVIYGTNRTGLFGQTSGATIENLTIDTFEISGVDYVGLFGYPGATTTVRGVNLYSGTVTGNDYVGLLLGRGASLTLIFNTINIQGTVTGRNYVGGAGGHVTAASLKSLVVSADVTGLDNVGGIAGSLYALSSSGILNDSIYKSGTVTDTDISGNYARISGQGGSLANNFANETILVNGITVASNTLNGTNIPAASLNHISVYEGVVDTFIGGDNDLDGYYFDYNGSGEIVAVKAQAPTPLSGSGTTIDPYLIYNYNDLKKASYDITKSYKLMSNINLLNEKIYPFGSNKNEFSGTFDGNGYTLSNMIIYGTNRTGLFGQTLGATVENLTVDTFTISGIDYVGLFGYPGATTTVKGLNLYNGTVTGNDYVGLLVGRGFYSTLVFNTINIQGTVTGRNYVGGAGGYVTAASLKSLVVSADVTGLDSVGGIVGNLYAISSSGIVNDSIYKEGTVTDTDNTGYFSRISGRGGSLSNNFANETILVNGVTVASNTLNGTNIPAASLNHISVYEGVVDTFIGGDNDLDGYYFDYNGSGEIVAVKAQAPTPLSGSGTTIDPYLIYNYNDLKKASYDITKSYKLMSNINLLNEKIYPFGSNKNEFSGTFDGNGYTLSNMIIYGTNRTGLFGQISGATVENITIDTFTISGIDYVGLFGYAAGNSIVKGLNLYNGTVTGNDNVGLLLGRAFYTSTLFEFINATGTATGNNYVGGIVGYNTGTVLNRIVFSGNVSGSSYVAGIIGYRSSGTNAGFVNRGGNITGTTYANRVTSYNGPTSAIANNTILVNGSTVTSSTLSSLHGQDKTPAELLLQSTYTAIGFNFTDTTPGTYIWRISGSDIWVERN